MRRAVAVVIVAVAALAPSSAVAQDEPPASLVEQMITAADASLGDESTIAVLRAADRGYDLLQIIEGLFESKVAADGIVTDEEGVVVAPTLAAAGVIEENELGGASGPVGGASRAAGGSGISGERIGILLLERGIGKTSAKLDKKDDLGERASAYDTSVDLFTMLTVLVLIDSGYSIEQIIVDGFMAQNVDIGFDGSIVILDEKGRVLRPDGDEPSFGDDVETASTVDNFIDDVSGALTGEDPLHVADESFKRQFTLTIDVAIVGDGSTGTIKGKANLGDRKRHVDLLVGRGTGSLSVEGACSLSEFDTNPYPYTIDVPLRFGIAGGLDGDEATLNFGIIATSAAKVTAEGDSFCIQVIRDLADAYPQFIQIPEVVVRLRDGATANASGQDAAAEFTADITVSVKKI